MERDYTTREDYLVSALQEMRESLFRSCGFQVPPRVRVSCGFPKGSRGGRKAIGQAWDVSVSEDGTFEIFISPVLGRQDPITVLGVLVHEIAHTIAGLAAKHGPAFRRVAESCGLAGKMTATVPGEDLAHYLEILASRMGPYPHGSMQDITKQKGPGSRLLKAECPGCGYIIRASRECFDRGMPVCPCGETFQEA